MVASKICGKALFRGALAVVSFTLAQQALGQAQVQYTYDAAGNVVQVSRVGKPDLRVSGLSVSSIAQHPLGGYDISASFTVSNAGNVAASPTWYDRGYLSSTGALHDTDPQLSGFNTRSVALVPGASYSVSLILSTSASTPAGATYLVVKADGGTDASGQFSPTGANLVDETDETNNTAALAITLPTQVADLAVTSASLGTIVVNHDGSYSLPITYTVKNLGGAAASPTWYDLAYLSTSSTLDNTAANLSGFNSHNGSLAVGSTYTATTTYTAASSSIPGAYTLFFKADGHGPAVGIGSITDNGSVTESVETNNVVAIPATLPTKPDLKITSATLGTVVVAQDGSYTIPITYTVTNAGGSTAQPQWYDLAYLSTDATLDNSDVNLGSFANHSPSLASGASYTSTINFTATSSTSPGAYTIFMKTDAHGATVGVGSNTDGGNLAESDDTNNAVALPVTLPVRPDLQLSNVTVGTITKVSGAYNIPVTYTVTNVGGSTAQPTWYDLAYLSTDGTLDNTDKNLGGWTSRGSPLAPGASYTNTVTFNTTTTTTSGAYTLFIKTDAHGTTLGMGGTNTDGGNLGEVSETNNALSVSINLP